MRNSFLALGAAAFASLCCTGPILLATLGATSLAGFSWLEPVRPYLSIGAVGLVGWAFWRSYRPQAAEACCSLDERVKLTRQRRTLWLAAPLVALLLAFPYIQASSMTDGQSGNAGQVEQGTASTWAIAEMTCTGCAAGLEASLAAQPGMLTCDVIFEDRHMQCVIDGEKLGEGAIPQLVDQLGFTARLIEQPVDFKTAPTAWPKPRGDDHV